LVIDISAHISTLRIGHLRCPETSVSNCKAAPRNLSEEQSPKSRTERMRLQTRVFYWLQVLVEKLAIAQN